MGCFSGRLISSASDQKLFRGVCSAFKCSFDEFVGEKVVSPSYSSAILSPPGFPYFLQFKSEFCNKVFMIWATVSSRFCFIWLYTASPSLAAKNIINLISILTIWWCPCVELSLVLLEGGVCKSSAFSCQNVVRFPTTGLQRDSPEGDLGTVWICS